MSSQTQNERAGELQDIAPWRSQPVAMTEDHSSSGEDEEMSETPVPSSPSSSPSSPTPSTSSGSPPATRRTKSPSRSRKPGSQKAAVIKAKAIRALKKNCTSCRSLTGHPNEADLLAKHPELASLEPSREKREHHGHCTMASNCASGSGAWFMCTTDLMNHRIQYHAEEIKRIQAEDFRAAAERHKDDGKKQVGTAQNPICLD